MNIFALDIGGTSIKYGLFRDEELVYRSEIPSTVSFGTEVLFETIEKLLTDNPAEAVGISTAGQVDVDKSEIIHSTDAIPGWQGMKLKQRLESLFSVPVAVENDGNAAALGEAYYGNGRCYQNLVCLV
ncbi:MAG TPA: ROK family protein, partial [Clostridiales bacterium]|nr:ROK family protein [Clostridiales bacterium]